MTVRLFMGDIFTIAKAPESEMSILEGLLTFWDPKSIYKKRPWEDDKNYLLFKSDQLDGAHKFYTGITPIVKRRLEKKGVDVVIENDFSLLYERGPIVTLPEDYIDGVTLRDYQIQAIRSAIHRQRGILQLPARSGKTEIAAAMIKYYDRPTLFVTHTNNLLEQTARNFERRGLGPVGIMTGGTRKLEKVTVAMVQTLSNKLLDLNDVAVECVSRAEVLFFDEVHHLQAPTWSLIGEACKARYRFGLSATPFLYKEREDNFGDTSLTGLTGEVVASLDPRVLVSKGFLAPPKIFYITTDHPSIVVPEEVDDKLIWQYVYENGVINNEQRNEKFINVAGTMYDAGMKILMLVSRINHGMDLLKRMIHRVPMEDCIFTKGQGQVYRQNRFGMKGEKWPFEFVRKFFEERKACVVIGTQIMDEGVDVPSLDAVLLLSAMRSFRLTIQRATRSMTAEDGKRNAWIVDCFDANHPMLRAQAIKRMSILRKEYPGAPIVRSEDALFNEIDNEKLLRS